MTLENINFGRLANFLIIAGILIALLVLGKGLLVPIAFSILLAFMLYPIAGFFERKLKMPRVLATVVTFLVMIIVFGSLIFIFGWQLSNITIDLSKAEEEITTAVESAQTWIMERFNFKEEELEKILQDFIAKPLTMIGAGIASTTISIVNILMVLVYTFLLLIYRTSFKNFFITQFSSANQSTGRKLLTDIKRVVQGYFYGLFIVIIILGVLNSIGLWIIGIDYPWFWGMMAGLLAIIPYVGVFIGIVLPFLYAVIYTGTLWQPLAIVGWFTLVQQLEGNLITPNIVGRSVKINPLAAIFSLVLGGFIWGIPGMILALPSIALLKVLFSYVPSLQPMAFLLSSDIFDKENKFKKEFDNSQNRFINLFRKKEDRK